MKDLCIPKKLICLLIATLGIVNEGKAQFVPTSLTFTYTGSMQQFTVPPCVGSMTIEAKGASGGTGSGGGPAGANGGSVKGVFTATPGTVLHFFVGGQGSVTAGGYNGGGNGGTGSLTSGGGGGGASDVRLGGINLSDRIIVAGGGGGSGGNSISNPLGGTGGGGVPFTLGSGYGGGGMLSSEVCTLVVSGTYTNGGPVCIGCAGNPPGGGGYSSGGGGALVWGSPGSSGCAGTIGTGGNGGGISLACGGSSIGMNGGGGGGGGHYGGGGGNSAFTTSGSSVICNSGGGGGSSWSNNSIFSNLSYTAGNNSGHGLITITYILNGLEMIPSATPAVICTGSQATLSVSGASSYTWSNSSVSNTIVVSPTVTTTYSVAGTNSIGCMAYGAITVTVNTALPNLIVSASAYSICTSNSVILTAIGGITNTWSGGVSNGIAFNPTLTNTYIASAQNACGTSTAAITITVTPLPVIAAVSPTAICSGSSATLSSSGAANYTWQPSGLMGSSVLASPMSSTIYTVTGSSGLCSNSNTVSLSVAPAPTILISTSSWSICSGTNATLSALGASNYTWQPGNQTGSSIVVSPGASTVFMVTGANQLNCTSNANQAIIVFPSPSLTSVSSSSTICAGASVTLSASGANSYLWNNGSNSSSLVLSPLVSTIYSVIGTNTSNSCSASLSVGISVYISSLTVTPPSSICMGGTIHLSASGANSYTWNTGSNNSSISVSPASSTGYSVQALTNFPGLTCSSYGTTSVTVNPLPLVTAQATKTIVCKNSPSTTLTAAGAQTYLWNTSSTLQSIVVTPPVSTVYTVTGTDANNCVNSVTVQILVDPCTGTGENLSAGNPILRVYPNPSRSVFTVKAEKAMELVLVNELGQVLRKLQLSTENNFEVQVSNLAVGIYFIQPKENSGQYIHKVLVQD